MTTNIATIPTQSRRLLECGVDPKTADMSIRIITEPYLVESVMWYTPELKTLPYSEAKVIYGNDEITPAWSLSALLALLPEKIEDGYWLTIQKCSRGKNEPVYYGIAYFKCKWDNPEDISNSAITTLGRLKYFTDRNLIEAVCKIIEWLTANNYKLNQL